MEKCSSWLRIIPNSKQGQILYTAFMTNRRRNSTSTFHQQPICSPWTAAFFNLKNKFFKKMFYQPSTCYCLLVCLIDELRSCGHYFATVDWLGSSQIECCFHYHPCHLIVSEQNAVTSLVALTWCQSGSSAQYALTINTMMSRALEIHSDGDIAWLLFITREAIFYVFSRQFVLYLM